jgi:hypothetical protein
MSALINGLVTVSAAGTAVQFSSSPLKVKAIFIYASLGNSGAVYIGDSTVDSTNAPDLNPGEHYEIEFKSESHDTPGELSDVYADAATSGNTVRYLAITL